MKKYLYPLIVIFAIVIGVGAGTAYNIETSKGDIQNVGISNVYLLTKYNTADTLYNFGSTPIGKFKNIYCEVQGLSDSIRTIELRTVSKISADTSIAISMTRIDSTSTLRVSGAQSLNAGQRKIFKVEGDYDNLVIVGEGRYNVKVRFWATGFQE